MSELYHHGIKGMKWGVRRYQNEDGTLTAEGRQKIKDRFYKKKDRIEKRIERKKGRSKYTNEELKELQKNGIADPGVISKYVSLKTQHDSNLRTQGLTGYDTQFSLGTMQRYGRSGAKSLGVDSIRTDLGLYNEKEILTGIYNERVSTLTARYQRQSAAAQKYMAKHKEIRSMSVDDLLNSDIGYRNIRRSVNRL